MAKKIILGLAAAIAFAACILAFGTLSSDAGQYVEDGDYEYYIEDGQAELIRYNNETATALIIPEVVIYDGSIYPVWSISTYSVPANIKFVTITGNVSNIERQIYDNDSELKGFFITPDNHYFDLIDNCVCDTNKKIITYPPACTDTFVDLTSASAIGEYAFIGAKNITDVLLPDTLTTISEGAFQDCTGLRCISNTIGDPENIMPQSLMIIDTCAFNGCTSLTTFTLNDNTKMIGASAFSGCTSLTSIHLGAKLTYIDRQAFYNCSSLKDITVDQANGSYAVSNDEGYEGILMRLSASDYISIAVYPGGYERETLIIDDRIRIIDPYSFDFGMGNLKHLIFEKKYSAINNHAFYNCQSLETVTFSYPVTAIEECAFYGCTSLKTLRYETNELVTIGDYAFSCCRSLVDTEFPETLKSIGMGAFMDTNVTHITMSDGLVSIGEYAFAASNLSDVTIHGKPYIGYGAFDVDGDLHITKQYDFEIPSNAFGDLTVVTIDNFDEWKFPMYNVIGIIVCVIILVGMILLFRKI